MLRCSIQPSGNRTGSRACKGQGNGKVSERKLKIKSLNEFAIKVSQPLCTVDVIVCVRGDAELNNTRSSFLNAWTEGDINGFGLMAGAADAIEIR